MSRPTLSVLMPNYNHSQYLPQAIEAVVSQSRPPDEFIILDDGSTDNSVEIIEGYARQHSFIRILKHEPNRGVVAATKALLEAAQGEWLLFASADDYALPGFFEQAMALAERYPQAGILFGQVALVEEGAEDRQIELRQVEHWREPLFALPEVFRREYLEATPTWYSPTHATLYRRAVLEELGGFRPELGHLSDAFALRAAGLKCGAGYLPHPCMTWRVTAGSYAHREGSDAPAMVQITAHLVSLMRSPEYRELFPERYARRWQRDLERMTLERYIWQLREPLGLSAWGMLRGRLLKRYLMLQVALRYRGDVAAFIRSREQRD